MLKKLSCEEIRNLYWLLALIFVIDLLLTIIFIQANVFIALVKALIEVTLIWFYLKSVIVISRSKWDTVVIDRKNAQTLQNINHIFLANLNFLENLPNLVKQLNTLIKFDHCLFLRMKGEEGCINFYSNISSSSISKNLKNPRNLFGEEQICHGTWKVISQERSLKGWRDLLNGEHIQLMLQIPITYEGRLLGIFLLSRKEQVHFLEEELTSLRGIMESLTFAWHNYLVYTEAKKLSLTDHLTDCANRRALDIRLEYEYRRAKRYKEPFSLLVVDIDFFKKLNDQYGHLIGDDVLKELAQLLKNQVRDIDLVSRFGGEEFVILLSETNQEQAYAIAERIRNQISEYIFLPGKSKINITVSIGVASYNDEIDGIRKILEGADLKLFSAKTFGRNQVVVLT